MGVLRPRNNDRKLSRSTSSGSMPVASKSPAFATLRRPKRRGSTKRSSLPDDNLRIAWVCLAISVCGSQTCRRPVMPRWTIHWALPFVGRAPSPASAGVVDARREATSLPIRFRFGSRPVAGEGARATQSRSKTMCFPMRRTAAMRLCSRVAAISVAGDFSGSFFWPSQTDSITSPVTRLARPRAMVSTSGSSGMGFQERRSITTKGTKVHEGKSNTLRASSDS